MSRISDDEGTDPTSARTHLTKPTTFAANGAAWQIFPDRDIHVKGDDTIDDATFAACPLPAATLDTFIGETKAFFGLTPFVRYLNKLFIDDESVFYICCLPISLDDTEQNRAITAGRAGAENGAPTHGEFQSPGNRC